ncbi:uncharacterized protein BP5553_07275 [Venustampulla echinocandica]|uniref:gamma-glutamylcyclotransferase n=1 Tax=Venustampulla echinocandica TaxID=2656787 RepID=A0A370TJ00_9HELO|nr:uncharacterized protein BP5553_07275 [Venustampulla echinocandica]RDL35344.1 hypothetical protein BP5553_07275 [Venustampulla echinocandica]
MTITTKPATLYFAYGSNLSLTQMSQRCPSSPYYGLGKLPGYRWIIGERGYANVVKCPTSSSASSSSGTTSTTTRGEDGEENQVLEDAAKGNDEGAEEYVIGMLYALTHKDEARLDIAEGVPFSYTKHMLPIQMLSSPSSTGQTTVQALVYVDEVRLGEGVCREEYVTRMNRGIADAVKMGMPKEYVERVLRRFVREDEVEGVVHDPFLGVLKED